MSPSTPTSVTVRVPGSTSNLGPGFDTLGIALSLYNRVRITRNETAAPRITSPIAEEARPGATALIAEAAALYFRSTGQDPFGFDIHLSGDVPIARGLGSSVTVRLGTLAALHVLTGRALDRRQLFQWVTELEGHPDNAAPATFGGFTAAGIIDGEARCLRLTVHPALRFVAVIPPFEVSTEAARRLLPPSYARADVVHNLSRVALIVAAFAQGDTDSLRGLFEDRLHQPYREPLIPSLRAVVRAGVRAGAVGGWLSGSGSTILCVTLADPEAVGRAMAGEIPGGAIRILRADTRGFTTSRSSPSPAA